MVMEMNKRQESKKQDPNIVMIKGGIPYTGYGKCNPGRRNAKLEHPFRAYGSTRVTQDLTQTLTEQP